MSTDNNDRDSEEDKKEFEAWVESELVKLWHRFNSDEFGDEELAMIIWRDGSVRIVNQAGDIKADLNDFNIRVR